MRLTASAAIVGCLAAMPASAAAGTVSSNPTVRNGYPVLDMRFRAADGERNRLTIGIDAQAVEFRDAIGITAGVGCVQISLRQARCPLPSEDATRLRVRAADRDDTVVLARGHLAQEQPDPILRDEEYIPCCTGEVYGGMFGDGGDDTLAGDARLRGGLGNDRMRGSRLRGGPGQDRLTGTHDADAIAGGAGRDVIRGGAGNDSIFAAFDEPVPASDVFVGGPGLDTLDYSEARTPSVGQPWEGSRARRPGG